MKIKMPQNKAEWMLFAKNTALILLGTFVLAFGISMFIFPFDLVTGGISGIGIILSKATAHIPVLSAIGPDTYSSVVNWILFVIGFFLLGRSFAMKTLLSTVFYPVALYVSDYIVRGSSMAYLFDLSRYPAEYYNIALIVATIFGGALIGAGCAFTFLGGGSTGGVDVIALTLSKYCKRIKSSVAFFICDTLVIIVGIFAVGNLLLSLLGIFSAFICAISIDKLFLGESSAFIAQIVSDKYEELNLAIREEVRRTTTMFVAYGGYSGQSKTVLSVTFTMRQYATLMTLIKRIDPTAFVSISRAHEINGEGFTFGQHS